MVDFSKTVGNIPTLPALAIGTDFALLSGIFEYSYRPEISSYLLPALTREVKLCTLLNISRYSYSAQIQIHLPPLIERSYCVFLSCILQYSYRSDPRFRLISLAIPNRKLRLWICLLHFGIFLQIPNLNSSLDSPNDTPTFCSIVIDHKSHLISCEIQEGQIVHPFHPFCHTPMAFTARLISCQLQQVNQIVHHFPTFWNISLDLKYRHISFQPLIGRPDCDRS